MKFSFGVGVAVLVALTIGQYYNIATEAKTPSWPNPYWDIPGDYCRAQYPEGRCCEGRNDPCSVPILGTLCYCDNFCNRTENSDCCPDYFSHCEGLTDVQFSEQRPEEIIRPEDLICPQGVRTSDIDDSRCYDDGRYYSTRDTVKKNCNHCRCQVSIGNSRCMELLCETSECYYDQDLYDRLEEDHYRGRIHWKPKNCSAFWGHSIDELVTKRLGTFLPEDSDKRMFDMIPIKFNYDSNSLPTRFDSREKWPDQIHPILDQGWCGASWAFSTISVASDRMAIDSEGENNFNMSPQSLISCNTHGQLGCGGGYIDRAWHFLRKFGTVPEECYSYETNQGDCNLPRSSQHEILKEPFLEKFPILKSCEALKGRRGLFKMQPSYRVGRPNNSKHPKRTEHDIMFEILTHGPVQAIIDVSKDFFLYGSGIYERSYQVTGHPVGHHSIKILGWGSDDGVDFWLAANSWGEEWGEEGYFKIRRGSNECNIESQVVGAWAQTQEVTEEIEKYRQQFQGSRRNRRKRHHKNKLV